jgi:hypothetical protein
MEKSLVEELAGSLGLISQQLPFPLKERYLQTLRKLAQPLN